MNIQILGDNVFGPERLSLVLLGSRWEQRWGKGGDRPPCADDLCVLGITRHPTRVGIVPFADKKMGPGMLGDLPEVTELGRGRARITPHRWIPALTLTAPEEQDVGQ